MMERHDHKKPWAEKLQDIHLPEESVAWEAMKDVLDKEMPVGKWGDRRRWLLLIILLLLLIGVCNCPGRRLIGDKVTSGSHGGPPHGDASHDVPTAGRGKKEDPATIHKVVVEERVAVTDDGKRDEKDRRAGKIVADAQATGKGKGSKTRLHRTIAEDKVTGSAYNDPEVDLGKKEDLAGAHQVTGEDGVTTGEDEVRGAGDRKGKVPGTKGNAGIAGTPKAASLRLDSAAAAARKPKNDSFVQVKGWLAGVGLNQFFTVGQQQRSEYNSSGTTGGLGDYIPVPMVRYYFSRKLYVQMEAQFNTPQYTSKNLLASQSAPDSFSYPGRIAQTSLYIKKLFYFNLPLSIHYSPIPNLYVGAGIQYARLTNGVALFQNNGRSIFIGRRDTVLSSKIQSFKNDTVYRKLKTNEFRLLLDLNYTYSRFVVGARYNRALSEFINVQISNNQVSQSRNSSFQVYLRYIIWDGRKKILLPK